MRNYVLTALLLLQLHASSQSISTAAVNSSGGSYSQADLQIDWSIGEMSLVNTARSGDGLFYISHGLLQPDMRSSGGGSQFSSDEIRVLPNPTYNQVELQIATTQSGELSIQVFDVSGKRLKEKRLTITGIPVSERVDLSLFASGTYLIKAHLLPAAGSQARSGAFKIIKL